MKPEFNGFDCRSLSLEEGKEIWLKNQGLVFTSMPGDPKKLMGMVHPGEDWSVRISHLYDKRSNIYLVPISPNARVFIRETIVCGWIEVHHVPRGLAEKVYFAPGFPGKLKNIDLIFMAIEDQHVHPAFINFPSDAWEFKKWRERWGDAVEPYVRSGGHTFLLSFCRLVSTLL